MSSYGSINVHNEEEHEHLLSEDNIITKDSQFILEVTPVRTFQYLTFDWFAPLLKKGYSKGQLDLDDLEILPLPPSCSTQNVTDAFEKNWKENFKRYNNSSKIHSPAAVSTEKDDGDVFLVGKREEKPSLVWNLARTYGKNYLIAGILKLIHDICIFVGPVVLHDLIQFLRDPSRKLYEGFFLTATVTISQLTMSFCLRHYFFECYLTGLRLRTAIVTAVYKKALKLSSTERQNRTTGEIVNLMTIDAQRVQDLTTYGHAVWYSFLQIGVAIYFLWQQLGPSCLGGVAIMCILVPVNKVVAGWMSKLQAKLMKARDHRVQVNTEVFSNVKVIKCQAWEESFQRRILDLRETELHHLLIYSIGQAATIMLYTSVPLMVALATFTAYTLSGNDLDVANALTALALFDILRFPLFMFPQVVNNLVEAGVSFDRIQKFLLCKEHIQLQVGNIAGDSGIEVDGATFVYDSKKPKKEESTLEGENERFMAKQILDQRWEIMLLKSQLEDAENKLKTLSNNFGDEELKNAVNISDGGTYFSNLLSLRRIDFKCKRGEFIAVVGSVGSGKSTFLNSFLGEVRALSGAVSLKGRLSYFPQMPFIMNDTLKNNVIFSHQGEAINEDKYKRVISACALEHDLTLMSDGDSTEIGERGITLSGGQKARVALARAVYHDADIYLLDDPIAAVDAHVGKHIFQKCIIDELLLQRNSLPSTFDNTRKKSTVILVTNAIQYLSNPEVDKIVVIDNGCIAEAGTYKELSEKSESIFSTFLSAMVHSDVESNDGISESTEVVEDEVEKCENDIPSNFTSLPPPKKVRRRTSSASQKRERDKISTSPLMTDELHEREKGHVGLDVYLAWIRAAGGIAVIFFVIISYMVDQTFSILSKWWLTHWSQNEGNVDRTEFLRVYALINLGALVTIFFRVLFLLRSGLTASKILFAEVLDVLLRSPMEFFDTTPLGRIVNRFSKDMYTIDESLVAKLRSYLATASNVIGVIIVISWATPYFTLCLIPIIIFYVRQQIYFTSTFRELRRLDSVCRSPLYSLLGETLDGMSTIRAFNAQPTLIRRMYALLDKQQNAYFLTITAQCWLAVRLELVGTLIIFFACLCAVLEHPQQGGDENFAGLAGLSISFALSVTQSLNWSVRMGSDLEGSMVSVERIRQYSNLLVEAPHHMPSDEGLGAKWPALGMIQFSSVNMRYRMGLPLVLKGLNITLPAKSKVGVVGRTGAGKSTLMVSLLRLVELDYGSIFIDGIDISGIGLNYLRSKIAVIPQDPILFAGTVKTNLDPFQEFDDERLDEVLKRVGLKSAMERAPSSNSLTSLSFEKAPQHAVSLSDSVSEGGTNFSLGQRQLLFIARALLRRTKIVIMDEATASVDAQTDKKIQRVMRTDFEHSTCITVAHRINTIMDSDYILVMDDGYVAEFDPPSDLIKKEGLFKDLVDAWEKENVDEL